MSSSDDDDQIYLCGTWPFCAKPFEEQQLAATSQSLSLLSSIVLNAIETVELNPNQPTVGSPGSVPNNQGIHELDAAWMRNVVVTTKTNEEQEQQEEDVDDESSGGDGEAGAILSLRGFNGAIRAAHQVALTSPHSILAGKGAEEFTRKWLMNETTSDNLKEKLVMSANDESSSQEETNNDDTNQHHQDTLGVVALRKSTTTKSESSIDDDKNKKNPSPTRTRIEIIAAVSSSGLGKKEPGRIGDSPLFGSGLYCDAEVGAVTATGDGDAVALFPISFVAVQEMKRIIRSMSSSSLSSTPDKINNNGDNIVDIACRFAIQEFLKSSNVKAFIRNKKNIHRLSKGGPLIGLCGVCYYSSSYENDNDNIIIVQSGGACCNHWTYEYVTSHLSFDVKFYYY